MEIEKIAVIGAGAMGHGIAQLAAMAGFEVVMRDLNQEILTRAMEKIEWSLGKFVEKNRIAEQDAEKAIERIRPVVSVKEAMEDAGFSIEAVSEKLGLKKQIFKEIDEYAQPHTIFATNTSALPISEIAESAKRPDKVVGMHFSTHPS